MLQENTKYFALSEYARVGKALTLYDVEDKIAAIAEMDYVFISLKGNRGMERDGTCRKFNLKQFVLHFWSATLLERNNGDSYSQELWQVRMGKHRYHGRR
ncbi:hypothetical protein Tco_1317520 [Tanacetum coccineum]